MTKQVQLSDRAYMFLKANKRDGESFSDVVLRLGKRRKSLMAVAGAGLFEPGFDPMALRRQDRAKDDARWQRLERRRRGRP